MSHAKNNIWNAPRKTRVRSSTPPTEGEKRAYHRGYQACVAKKWPEHKPPHPPAPIVRAMFEAARKLRDKADDFIATTDCDADHSSEEIFGEAINAIDDASRELTEWLKSQDA